MATPNVFVKHSEVLFVRCSEVLFVKYSTVLFVKYSEVLFVRYSAQYWEDLSNSSFVCSSIPLFIQQINAEYLLSEH